MPLRLTAPEKWRDSWFRRLKPLQKCFWLWMLDQCDIAGTVDIDLELASHEIGGKIKSLEGFEGRLVHVKDTRYWIKGFIEFQQKCGIDQLNPANKAHLGILRLIEKYGLLSLSERGLEGATKPLDRGTGIGIGIGIGVGDAPKVEKPKFVPPSLSEVEGYMNAQMPAVARRCPGAAKIVFPAQEAPKFIGYYTQTEWKIKSKPMVSWQQSAYNWLIKAYQFKQEKA